MKKIFLGPLLILLISTVPTPGQEIYRWVDEKGTLHFADDLSLVPEKYRTQAEKKRLPAGPSDLVPPTPSPSPSPPSDTGQPRRDRFGRGEDWWRAKVKEWEEKLHQAENHYEKMHRAQKEKEKEWEDAKFQPKSVKRRLQAELEELEKKAKAFEAEIIEAKTMLEKVLPRQAEEDRADPMWLKPRRPQESGQQVLPSPEPVPPARTP